MNAEAIAVQLPGLSNALLLRNLHDTFLLTKYFPRIQPQEIAGIVEENQEEAAYRHLREEEGLRWRQCARWLRKQESLLRRSRQLLLERDQLAMRCASRSTGLCVNSTIILTR
jgi:hypothetical protein